MGHQNSGPAIPHLKQQKYYVLKMGGEGFDHPTTPQRNFYLENVPSGPHWVIHPLRNI